MGSKPSGKHLVAGDWVSGEGLFASAPAHGPVHQLAAGTVDLVDRACKATGLTFLCKGVMAKIGTPDQLSGVPRNPETQKLPAGIR